MQLKNDYQRDDFLKFLEEDFLTDFKKDTKPVNTSGLTSIRKAYYLGESKNLDLQVFEFLFEGSPNKRIALTKDAFIVMRSSAIFKALAIFHSPNSKDWRFSLMTATPEPTEKGKVSLSYSNPKRLSFFLGPNARVNTPTKYLLNKGKITDFNDLKNRFSIEVVNKEFYKEISQAFTKLVDGLLKLPSSQDKSRTNLEFAVRLIGRIIFCWFLREKKSSSGLALMPQEILSLEAVKKNDDYYHKILEPIFFEILNKPIKSRRDDFAQEPFSSVPYLNGGLFSPQDDDYYKRTNDDYQSQYHNTLVIPDDWFKRFFEILETYNFTIDENTSYDEELSIDPEMLGRIFENLLAEINPETGESARKSTGSYYTPRIIVNYMVDESLLLYLKEKTGIKEEKLRAIISYDLDDDLENPVTNEEKEKIIDALEKVKILDPACGSGAFPMGALQKIVFILQQTDPVGQLWFKKQIKNTAPEVRRIIEREFEHKNFDWLRKIGIIRENIYGVDIQPIATEISRLRCFLTLIVDERVQDESENRGIEPLPNLDFKFVTANSLISLPKIDQPQQSLLDDYKGIGELKAIRDQYFTASGIERGRLKAEFSEKQNELINELIANHDFAGYAKAELTRKLTSWRPFKHTTTDWFDPEWMFGVKDGFDIVIANPPYLTLSLGKGQKVNTKEEIKLLTDLYSDIKEYKNNLFSFFIRRSFDILDKNGVLTYIVPDVLLYNKNFSRIRNYLLNNSTINYLFDLKGTVFESAVIGGNCIFSTVKNNTYHDYAIRTSIINNISDFFLGSTKDIFASLYKTTPNNKFFLDLDLYKLLDKLSNNSTKLGELVSFYNGIKTGDNNRFISDVKNNEKYVPVVRGRDIFPFSPLFTEVFVMFDKSKLWSNTNEELLSKHPKLLVRQTGDSIVSTIDNIGLFHMDTTHSIFNSKIDLKFILGLLNSRLITWWHKTYTSEEDRAFAEVKIVNLKEIPVKVTNKEIQNRIINYVDERLSLFVDKNSSNINDSANKIKIKIDNLVYELYELNEEEIEIIERDSKLQ